MIKKKYILKNVLKIKKYQNDKLLRNYFNIWKFNKTKKRTPIKNNDLLSKKYSAKIIYKFINNLYNPYAEFWNKIKFISKNKLLKNVISKLNNKSDKIRLKKYLKEWKENKDLIIGKKRKIIISWFKKQNEKNNKNKKALLKRIIMNKIKNNNNILLFQILYWNKISKILNGREQKQKQIIKLRKLSINLYKKYYFEQIKHIIKNGFEIKENYVNKKNKKIKKNDLNKKIKKIIISKNEKDKKDIIRNSFNDWKKNTQSYIEKSIIIQTFFRRILSKQKLQNIKQLKKIIFNIFIKHEKNLNSLILFNLRKWNMITKKLSCIHKIVIIQKNFRLFLNKNKKKKLKSFLIKI